MGNRDTLTGSAVPLGRLVRRRCGAQYWSYQKVSRPVDHLITRSPIMFVLPVSLTTIQASSVNQNATAVGVGLVGGNITAANVNRTTQVA